MLQIKKYLLMYFHYYDYICNIYLRVMSACIWDIFFWTKINLWNFWNSDLVVPTTTTRPHKLYRSLYLFYLRTNQRNIFFSYNHNSLTQQVKIKSVYFFVSVAGFYDFTIDERTFIRTKFNADISSNWLDGIRSTILLSSLI